jgi:hypothetical protein
VSESPGTIGGLYFELRAPTGQFESDLSRARNVAQRTGRDMSYALTSGFGMALAKAAVSVRAVTSAIDVLSAGVSLFRGRYEDAANAIRALPLVGTLEGTVSRFADALTGIPDDVLRRIAEYTERIATRQHAMESVAESIARMGALVPAAGDPLMNKALELRNKAFITADNEMAGDPFGQWQARRQAQAAYERAVAAIDEMRAKEKLADNEKRWANERADEAAKRKKEDDDELDRIVQRKREKQAERDAARAEAQRDAEWEAAKAAAARAKFDRETNALMRRQQFETDARVAELRLAGDEVGARRAAIEGQYGGLGGLIHVAEREGRYAEAELLRRRAYAEWEMAAGPEAARMAAGHFIQREQGRFSIGAGGAGDPLLNINSQQLNELRGIHRELRTPRPARAA